MFNAYGICDILPTYADCYIGQLITEPTNKTLWGKEKCPKVLNATFTPRYEWVGCGPVWKRNLDSTTRDHSGGKTPHGDP